MRTSIIASCLVLASACVSDLSGVDAGSSCPVATGTGKSHNSSISADTTWLAADNPHFVTFGFTIDKGATLTLAPCTEVRFKGGYAITVRGKLVAEGTPTSPIRVTADVASTPWTSIQMMGGSASLAHVTLENGGNPQDPNALAMLEARGDGFAPRQELLKVDNVTIKGSAKFGVSLRDGATFTKDSAALTISGAALGPIRTWPRLAGNIPSGTYTDNPVPEILLMADDIVTEDTTIRDRGVPYRLGTPSGSRDIIVGSSQPNATRTTLTIEAGVAIRVSATGRIFMSKSGTQATGVLIAQGTAAKPIVFSSGAATPAAGDWTGLWFDAPDSANKLDFVEVKHAGGPSQASSFHCEPTGGGFSTAEDAAILLFGKPSSAFITNTKVTASAGDGIGRSWSGDPVDFAATNTFSQIAKCNQSFPRATNGSCPATVPCVK